jgi:hypothetical protein
MTRADSGGAEFSSGGRGVSSSGPEAVGSGDNKLGLGSGLVVQELGWDEDVDEDVRIMVEADLKLVADQNPPPGMPAAIQT